MIFVTARRREDERVGELGAVDDQLAILLPVGNFSSQERRFPATESLLSRRSNGDARGVGDPGRHDPGPGLLAETRDS